MNRLKTIIPYASLALILAARASAAEFKVIANPSVSAGDVSIDDLKAVFLQTKTSIGDSHVTPVLEKSGVAHEAFLSKCVGKSDSALVTYYLSLVFTGKGSIPKTLSSDEEVAAYVSKTKGAVGYVSASAPAAGVKVLEVK
jgi:hypothetical protein